MANETGLALAANGYRDLYELLDAGQTPVDFIKCPLSPNSREEVAHALRYRPVVMHCWGPPGYSATRPEIPEPELLAELSDLSGTPFVSVHLDHLPSKDGDLSPEQLLARICEEVEKLRRITRKDILLENVPWYPWQERPRWSTDPTFITRAVLESGAYLLVDTAHARVAAWHRGEPVEDYLSGLPLDRAREIHTSGPRMSEEGLRDRHMALRDEDYATIHFVLKRAPKIELITSEYVGFREKTAHYGENDGPERLREELARLDQLRKDWAITLR